MEEEIMKYITENEINWEQRRYEIDKTMLPALHRSFAGSMNWQCETAVKYADRLIEELKKDEQRGETEQADESARTAQ